MQGQSTLDILRAHLNEPPVPLIEVDPDISPELSDLVDGMLAKQPHRRPTPAEILTVTGQLLARMQPSPD